MVYFPFASPCSRKDSTWVTYFKDIWEYTKQYTIENTPLIKISANIMLGKKAAAAAATGS